MKLLFRSYLASLSEREELDAILPDLLSELGYTVLSRPQRGTAQAGVDVAAVGKDEDGERKLFLFTVKQGDLTRQAWDGTLQALRSSLNEILDDYIPHRIHRRYKDLEIVICLVFGGDMQEQVRSKVSGFIDEHTTDRISFDEWNGDRLAGFLLQGILREDIMPKGTRSHFQKAVALVDQPEIAYEHFARLADELAAQAKNGKSRIRIARQLYIALWVLFVWARDIDNLEAPYRISELVLLHVWNLVRFHTAKKDKTQEQLALVLHSTVTLRVIIGSDFLNRKILPHVTSRYAISMAVATRSAADVNLKLFDLLGRIALTGLWIHWMMVRDPDPANRALGEEQISKWCAAGYDLIRNNGALFLPLQDQHAIEIALFLLFTARAKGGWDLANEWLAEMAGRFAFTVKTHGRYPCVFTEYRDLEVHPKEKTNDYRQEATSGSILIPLMAAYLSAFGNEAARGQLAALKGNELQHCTLQQWTPDNTSEEKIYVGRRDHGVAISDLPLSDRNAMLASIKEACTETPGFNELSAIVSGYDPIVLTACRHYRFPIPPQFWIDMVYRPEETTAEE